MSQGATKADDELLACTVLHVDMDAFYASVLLRDQPQLRGLPVVVAGGNERGVVLCATYPARRRGVSSGIPTAQARRICPELLVVPPDFGAFAAASSAIFEVFHTITPAVETLSIEEAFLHVGSVRRLADPLQLAREVRRRIAERERITCSVGIAATRPVAKLASRRCKPDGLLVIPPSRVREVMDPLDIGELWGVGPATRARMERLGVVTVRDVRALNQDVLRAALGPAGARHLAALVRGEEAGRLHRAFGPRVGGRSVGADRTLAVDVSERGEILAELLRLSVEVMARVRDADCRARTVAIRLRTTDFVTVTRSRTLAEPAATTREVYAAVVTLLDQERPGPRGRPLRLVGVRGDHPGPSAHRLGAVGPHRGRDRMAGGRGCLGPGASPFRSPRGGPRDAPEAPGRGVLRQVTPLHGRANRGPAYRLAGSVPRLRFVLRVTDLSAHPTPSAASPEGLQLREE